MAKRRGGKREKDRKKKVQDDLAALRRPLRGRRNCSAYRGKSAERKDRRRQARPSRLPSSPIRLVRPGQNIKEREGKKNNSRKKEREKGKGGKKSRAQGVSALFDVTPYSSAARPGITRRKGGKKGETEERRRQRERGPRSASPFYFLFRVVR